MDRLTTRERPTLGALAVAFLISLLNWVVDLVPPSVPGEVVASGYALVALAIAVLVGQAVQRLGERAPWAADSHAATVTYALTLNPEDHPLDRLQAARHLEQLGIHDLDAELDRLGIDTGAA